MLLILIDTETFFVSTNLLTVMVIVVPSYTIYPLSILCFNTIPLSFDEFSSYATLTFRPNASSVFCAFASD